MAQVKLQQYPREDFLAHPSLFPRPSTAISDAKLSAAIRSAFERSLKNKQGNITAPSQTPTELVSLCLQHLKERSDPILSPYFLSQCPLDEIFELDAIAHEMQRHRMRIGVFYQFLLIELMRARFSNVVDGKREGDVEAEISTPGFTKGLRLYISVKKSADTVGGQDVAGVVRRLETGATEEKNLTRPYLCVVCFTTPHRGIILPYELGRTMKRNRDGHPYSANCEVWSPGFVFPFVAGLDAEAVYRAALRQVGEFLPFHTLAHRKKCGALLVEKLRELQIISESTGRLDPLKFQQFITERRQAAVLDDED
jgi:hypothetical protein